MATQIRSSDPEDPLAGYSGLMLFPRTLASIPNTPKPFDSGDLHRVHSYLKSMPLHCPDKLLEQAKSIVDNVSELPKCERPSHVASKDKNKAVNAMDTENHQEQRPALGRKRARFSLKPKSSQPTVDLAPNMDIDKLKDPEEFFLAFEKFENAKRELQKQTGSVPMDLNQQNPSMASRCRRPGILGRSVKYKHHYSDVLSSQETLEENIFSSSDSNVRRETTKVDFASQEMGSADAELQEMESSGAIAKLENTVDGLLHELLAGNSDDLDGDGAVTLLQEHLQIKPIDVGELSLPDFHDVRKFDLKASGAKLSKPRKPLFDIQNVLKGITSTSKRNKQTESPVSSLASPTPPRNPLESIISLKKLISQANLSNDPFSAHNIQKSSSRNTSLESTKEQTDQVDVEMDSSPSCELGPMGIEENNNAGAIMSSPAVIMGGVGGSAQKSVHAPFSAHNLDQSLSRSSASESRIKQADQVLMEKDLSIPCEKGSPMIEENDNADVNINLLEVPENGIGGSPGKTVKDNLISHSGIDGCSDRPQAGVEDIAGSNCMDSGVVNERLDRPDCVAGIQINEPTESNDKVEDIPKETSDTVQPDLHMEDLAVEKLNSTQSEMGDQASSAPAEDHATNGSSKTTDTGSKQHDEGVQVATQVPPNGGSKKIPRRGKGSKREVSRRQSLAASGTSWDGGVRRSTRIRSRPLEYWRGERFLYGRVHQTLTTVIGIKYKSPGSQDGKPGIKVKSFVADQYKDLVDLAARY